VSHHGTTQGDRALAQPLPMRLRSRASSSAASGTASSSSSSASSSSSPGPPAGALPIVLEGETEVPLHGSSRLSFAQQKATQRVAFTAPSLLKYAFSVGAGDACALFYPIPVARGRSRILVRRGRNFATGRPMSRAALVAKHLENNVVFDQDMAFLRGQEARLQALKPDGWGGAWRQRQHGGSGGSGTSDATTAASGGEGSAGYVMPAEADRFVISFRKQLDSAAGALPWRSPPSRGRAHDAPLPRATLLDRYEQHTKHCAVCSEALELTDRLVGLCDASVQLASMATLVAVATAPVTAAATATAAASAAAAASYAATLRLGFLSAAGAAAFSTALLRAYVVGPTVGALSTRAAAAPLATAAASLAALFLLRPAPLFASRLVAVGLPLVTAGCAAHARRALRALRARFVYTEEAKALQTS